MKRRLWIAVSVFFAVVTVALCALWVRSYSWREAIVRNYGNDRFDVGSNSGILYVAQFRTLPSDEALLRPVWCYQYWPADTVVVPWHYSADSMGAWIPHWCLVLLFSCGGLAAISWFTLHFSLRRMLIVTTLVAVVLGIVCYTVR